MNRTQLLQLSADLDRVIELRSHDDDESRIGNSFGGAAKGAAIGGAIGAGAYGALAPQIGKLAIGEMADARKAGVTASGIVGKGSPLERKATAGYLRGFRSMSKGGLKGRLIGAGAGALGVGLAGAGIGGAYGLLRTPKTQEYSSKTEDLISLSAELDDVVEFGRGDIFKKMTGGHAVPRPPKGHTGEFYESAGKRYRIDTPALQAQDLSVMREMMPGSKYRFGNKRMLREAPYRNLSAELDQVINFDFMGMVKKYGPAVGKAALKWGGIGAAGGAVVGGVSGALSEDPNQSALGGALGGAAAGGLLGAAGGAGMRGMKINSAINKAAGLRVARSKAAAASVTPVAAAPTATAAADQMAAAAAQPAKASRTSAAYDPSRDYKKNPYTYQEAQRNNTFSSRLQSLVQLSAELDRAIEFEDLRGKPNRKGQRPEDNMRRGVGMGILSGSPVPGLGMLAGGIEAGAYRNAGAVLRKRDVYGHELFGVLGAGAGAGIGHAVSGGNPKAAVIGGLAGWGSSRYGISRRTLKKREEELKHGIMV